MFQRCTTECGYRDFRATRLKKAKDVVAFCLDYGYNATELTNPEKRRKAVQTILRSV